MKIGRKMKMSDDLKNCINEEIESCGTLRELSDRYAEVLTYMEESFGKMIDDSCMELLRRKES